MVFSSAVFLFTFLPITAIIYYILRGYLRNLWLLFVSLIFFAWSQPGYLIIMLASIVINYLSAIVVSKFRYRWILALSIAVNLLLLFYYKYYDFFIDSINHVLKTSIPLPGIILPIGISFFSFQGMSYVIDVFRGSVKVQKNPLNVALYIALFPQLVAGPIVRYSDIEKEILARSESLELFSEGISRFIIGLGKKTLIANTMAEIVDDIWKAGIDNNTVVIAWIGSIAYSLQIFFDFSGYSDMAIGIGKMFGFHFNENFDRPYISKSITEFWRRWHMSLSSWFRDYVYIPLGGNRRHLYRNLIIVFLLTGLWHGASWTFVIWGAWNALFIVIERALKSKKVVLIQNDNVRIILSHIYALMVVNIGWVIFRADNFGNALSYIGTMFGIGLGDKPGFTAGWYINRWSVMIFIIAILNICGAFDLVKKYIDNRFKAFFDISGIIVNYGILLLSIMRILAGGANPFIYFQF